MKQLFVGFGALSFAELYNYYYYLLIGKLNKQNVAM